MRRRFPRPSMTVGDPLAVEQHLPVEHQRAGDFHHHFMPLGGVLSRCPELIGDAGATDHSHEDDLTIATIVAPSGLRSEEAGSAGEDAASE